jgi:hypothetical protein
LATREQRRIEQLTAQVAHFKRRERNRLQYIRMLERELKKFGGSQARVYLEYANWVTTQTENVIDEETAARKEEAKTDVQRMLADLDNIGKGNKPS